MHLYINNQCSLDLDYFIDLVSQKILENLVKTNLNISIINIVELIIEYLNFERFLTVDNLSIP